MRRLLLLAAWSPLFVVLTASAPPEAWNRAEPGFAYEFPRDHAIHRGFKTEWWYYTGNLFDAHGQRFGYELTFFRQGLRPPSEQNPERSRFLVGDIMFAHFAVTDVNGRKFSYEQKTSRGAFGEAGFDEGRRIAWVEDWSLSFGQGGSFELAATSAEASIKLHLSPLSSPVIHGTDGVSQKSSNGEHASHYYSVPRLETTGELRTTREAFAVHGESWFDHEWATNQLAAEQIGWNWLSVQWQDGSALMLYEMRLTGGKIDPTSSGTLIRPDGSTQNLSSSSFEITPLRRWRSPRSGAIYPVEWKVKLLGEQIEFTVRAALDDQELTLAPVAYWEGAVDAAGSEHGRSIEGRGYLELTGYAAPLRELGK
ncbi:MAG TPA: lipocalin-like domain-containing protein [Chthoniobacterales bacterium]|nr:lipocalin-like domain-containing protein [Chthoniobacterales bacterium]